MGSLHRHVEGKQLQCQRLAVGRAQPVAIFREGSEDVLAPCCCSGRGWVGKTCGGGWEGAEGIEQGRGGHGQWIDGDGIMGCTACHLMQPMPACIVTRAPR